MSRFSPLWHLYVTRLHEFYRQPARLFWVYGFPTVLAVALGMAFNNREPEPVQVTVVALPGADPLVQELSSTLARGAQPGRPGIRFEVLPKTEAEHKLRTGKTPLLVEATKAGVTYTYDPTRPDAGPARSAVDDVLQRAAGRTDPTATKDVTVTEPGSRYIDFLIPGLMGLNAMGGGMWGIGFLVVNFRVNKMLKRLMATPMPRSQFLMALLGSRLTFLFPDMCVLLMMGRLLFHMPIRGSLALVVLIEVVGSLAFAGLGLLIASRATTTETISGLMNLVMMPMWILSGVFFSADRFPATVQPLIQALPLTQILNALRAVIQHGAGFAAISHSLLGLSIWAIVTFFLALRWFRWN